MLDITSQSQSPVFFFIFFYNSTLQNKLSRMLNPPVSKFRPHLSIRLKDIAEKRVSAKLKPIASTNTVFLGAIALSDP